MKKSTVAAILAVVMMSHACTPQQKPNPSPRPSPTDNPRADECPRADGQPCR